MAIQYALVSLLSLTYTTLSKRFLHLASFLISVSPWNKNARTSFLRALGTGGFDTVLDGMGTYFGLDHMSFFFLGFMGVAEADNSFTHSDVYATGEKGFNTIWPIVIVNGTKPELDIISDDANIVLSINYEHDVAVLGLPQDKS